MNAFISTIFKRRISGNSCTVGISKFGYLHSRKYHKKTMKQTCLRTRDVNKVELTNFQKNIHEQKASLQKRLFRPLPKMQYGKHIYQARFAPCLVYMLLVIIVKNIQIIFHLVNLAFAYTQMLNLLSEKLSIFFYCSNDQFVILWIFRIWGEPWKRMTNTPFIELRWS